MNHAHGHGQPKTGIQLIECPRDAMQGWKVLIPTEKKIAYLNALLRVGFDTIDFGSFVSPKAIPQMADTKAVLEGLNLEGTRSRLLAIVANERGAEEATAQAAIRFLGFPFSVSPTFQQRNTNSTMEESLLRVEKIRKLCEASGKTLVVYLSMAFGNPYGDAYDASILLEWAEAMVGRGIEVISLADTIGLASPRQIAAALDVLVPRYPSVSFGVHLHSTPHNWKKKLDAALGAGCRRFDGALKGIGGCPMAGDALVGNMDTEKIVSHLDERALSPQLDRAALRKAAAIAAEIFGSPQSSRDEVSS